MKRYLILIAAVLIISAVSVAMYLHSIHSSHRQVRQTESGNAATDLKETQQFFDEYPHRFGGSCFQFHGDYRHLRFSGDGRMLVSWGEVARLYDMQDLSLVPLTQASNIFSCGFTGDSHLATFHQSKKVVTHSSMPATFRVSPNLAVGAAAFSPIKEQLYLGLASKEPELSQIADGSVRSWSLFTGLEVDEFHPNVGSIEDICVSRGRFVAVRGDAGIVLWDVLSMKGAKIVSADSGTLRLASAAMCFSPDDRFLAVSFPGQMTKVWNTVTAELSLTLKLTPASLHTGATRLPVCFLNNRLIAHAVSKGRILIWDLIDNAEKSSIDTGHPRPVSDIDCVPGGSRLAVLLEDEPRKIRFWSLDSGQEIDPLQGHESIVKKVSYAAQGKRLVTSSTDGTIRVWDTRSGGLIANLRVAKRVFPEFHSPPFSVSADGSRLFSRKASEIIVLNVMDGSEIARFAAGEGAPYSFQFSETSDKLFCLVKEKEVAKPSDIDRYDTRLRCYEAKNGAVEWEIKNLGIFSSGLKVSPDGTIAATKVGPSGRGLIKFWDLETGELIHTLDGGAFEFAERGKSIIVSQYEGSGRIWSTKDWSPIGEPFKLPLAASDLTLSHDGAMLAVTSPRSQFDADVTLWDMISLKKIWERPIVNDSAPSSSNLVFSSDNRFLAGGCTDGTGVEWKLPEIE
ncbi:WD40 repeat domain-containing protein [Stieleria varia]|uniref:WD domain, G-beta repeat n=1 Tax=Stieleria varia TaxID=2528005 RepID=A0A5C6A5L5_9BACT|nr:WD40 repeat domain-containing protein [Stieleria varia]TWT94685.1 WD domain, G-beta repeat [Stieleria varia]